MKNMKQLLLALVATVSFTNVNVAATDADSSSKWSFSDYKPKGSSSWVFKGGMITMLVAGAARLGLWVGQNQKVIKRTKANDQVLTYLERFTEVAAAIGGTVAVGKVIHAYAAGEEAGSQAAAEGDKGKKALNDKQSKKFTAEEAAAFDKLTGKRKLAIVADKKVVASKADTAETEVSETDVANAKSVFANLARKKRGNMQLAVERAAVKAAAADSDLAKNYAKSTKSVTEWLTANTEATGDKKGRVKADVARTAEATNDKRINGIKAAKAAKAEAAAKLAAAAEEAAKAAAAKTKADEEAAAAAAKKAQEDADAEAARVAQEAAAKAAADAAAEAAKKAQEDADAEAARVAQEAAKAAAAKTKADEEAAAAAAKKAQEDADAEAARVAQEAAKAAADAAAETDNA